LGKVSELTFSAALGLAAALGFCGGQARPKFISVRRIFYAMASKRRGCCHGAEARLNYCSSCGYSEGLGATYHGLLSPLLLGAGDCVAVGHFAGLLATERRAALSVWYLVGVSSRIFVVVVLAKCEGPHCVDFLDGILQGSVAN
jgi:hypothetical protein